jgi:hypothetical protein
MLPQNFNKRSAEITLVNSMTPPDAATTPSQIEAPRLSSGKSDEDVVE